MSGSKSEMIGEREMSVPFDGHFCFFLIYDIINT